MSKVVNYLSVSLCIYDIYAAIALGGVGYQSVRHVTGVKCII